MIEKLGEGVSFETPLTIVGDSSLKGLGVDLTIGLVKMVAEVIIMKNEGFYSDKGIIL